MHLIKKTRCKKKKPLFSGFIFGGDGGSRRLLRLCLAYFWLGDRCFATVPASPLFAKNSSPNCFIYAQTLSGSTHIKMQKAQNCCTFCFGGVPSSFKEYRTFCLYLLPTCFLLHRLLFTQYRFSLFITL